MNLLKTILQKIHPLFLGRGGADAYLQQSSGERHGTRRTGQVFKRCSIFIYIQWSVGETGIESIVSPTHS